MPQKGEAHARAHARDPISFLVDLIFSVERQERRFRVRVLSREPLDQLIAKTTPSQCASAVAQADGRHAAGRVRLWTHSTTECEGKSFAVIAKPLSHACHSLVHCRTLLRASFVSLANARETAARARPARPQRWKAHFDSHRHDDSSFRLPCRLSKAMWGPDHMMLPLCHLAGSDERIRG